VMKDDVFPFTGCCCRLPGIVFRNRNKRRRLGFLRDRYGRCFDNRGCGLGGCRRSDRSRRWNHGRSITSQASNATHGQTHQDEYVGMFPRGDPTIQLGPNPSADDVHAPIRWVIYSSCLRRNIRRPEFTWGRKLCQRGVFERAPWQEFARSGRVRAGS
jgi:hypothetical protein